MQISKQSNQTSIIWTLSSHTPYSSSQSHLTSSNLRWSIRDPPQFVTFGAYKSSDNIFLLVPLDIQQTLLLAILPLYSTFRATHLRGALTLLSWSGQFKFSSSGAGERLACLQFYFAVAKSQEDRQYSCQDLCADILLGTSRDYRKSGCQSDDGTIEGNVLLGEP